MRASGVELSAEEHLRRVLFRFDCAEVVLFEEQPSGLLKVARDGKQWHLIQIQLVPELQGHGLGAWLIEGVLAEARKAEASVELDVVKGNPARRLYERLGFSVIAENPHTFDMRFSPDA
jgi:GNAT superfamily N-acetyltransferase